jgi:hypothetical protein
MAGFEILLKRQQQKFCQLSSGWKPEKPPEIPNANHQRKKIIVVESFA